jgi:hypothetical protein
MTEELKSFSITLRFPLSFINTLFGHVTERSHLIPFQLRDIIEF